MDYNTEVRRLGRMDKRLRALDGESPRCGVCGDDNPTHLEKHHVAGRANSEATVWLCRNHHADAGDWQEDLMADLRGEDPERDPLLKQAAVCYGIAALFIILAVLLIAWAAWNEKASADLVSAYGASWHGVTTAEVPK